MRICLGIWQNYEIGIKMYSFRRILFATNGKILNKLCGHLVTLMIMMIV